MQSATRIADVRGRIAAARAAGQRVALVPTMGALHEGHLCLVDVARSHADLVVLSIFVNPLQFGPAEDLDRYPRDLDGDRARARGRGVDLLFVPAAAEMYPTPPAVRVSAAPLSARWEGALRPAHFDGVLTVVTKLLHIVAPDVAVFGQKDLQQARLVALMVRELDFPVRVVVAPTVREPDGLAMSSRNRYLSASERARAVALVSALRAAAAAFAAGEREAAALEGAARAAFTAWHVDPEYVAVVSDETLEPLDRASDLSWMITAARVGATRLLDNMRLAHPA